RSRMEEQPEELGLGPMAILYAIFDQLVDEYAPVTNSLIADVDEVEDALFAREPDVPRRMYELLRDVLALQRALHPLEGILNQLLRRIANEGQSGGDGQKSQET